MEQAVAGPDDGQQQRGKDDLVDQVPPVSASSSTLASEAGSTEGELAAAAQQSQGDG
jgi:hypothetical protein